VLCHVELDGEVVFVGSIFEGQRFGLPCRGNSDVAFIEYFLDKVFAEARTGACDEEDLGGHSAY